MKLAICTLATVNIFDYSNQTAFWKRCYAKQHGYDFYEQNGAITFGRPAAWGKILMLERHLSEYDWLWWTDADSTIMNMDVKIADIISPDEQADILMGGDMNLINRRYPDEPGINTGSFLIRNTQWSFDFLRMVWDQTDCIGHPWWEQQAMLNILDSHMDWINTRIKIVPYNQIGFHYIRHPMCETAPLIHLPGIRHSQRIQFFRSFRPLGIVG